MIGHDQDLVGHLFATGLDYYIAGRCAARSHLSRVTGNIFHHSIEMLLKSELAKHVGLDDLKNKYGHNLNKLWRAVKDKHEGEELACFDRLIAGLDSFETVRYPNDYMKRGAVFKIEWSREPIVHEHDGQVLPQYSLYVVEIDALVARLFKVCHMNPAYFWGGSSGAKKESIVFQNAEAGGWL